jgi:NADH-quinone oxidoreductase subunit H
MIYQFLEFSNFIFIDFFFLFFSVCSLFLPVLISVAFLTLVERKILAAIQRRYGPDQVGFRGLLQPIADAIKLICKETVFPVLSNKFLYLISPIFSFFLSLISWVVIPVNEFGALINIDIGFLYIFGISSLGVYSIILSGWSSGSSYAFLGALRSAAQMISYEVSFGLTLVSILFCTNSLNIMEVVEFQINYIWFVFPFLPLFFIFFISTLAETNRPPFDLPEAEAELVAGYNVEYSSAGFALFFIAEYANIILMSTLNVLLFFGGWGPIFGLSIIPGSIWFSIKVIFFVVLFVWVRAVLPRYRYDQLMNIGWKVFLPLSLSYVFFSAVVLFI